MVWYQLQIEQCTNDEVEDLSEALEEQGALSVTLTDKHDDPILEPAPGCTPLWPVVVINALFDEEKLALSALNNVAPRYAEKKFSINAFADKDWQRVWMNDFKPQCFGTRLWICPSWITPPETDAVNLILDPGLAFGTGTHPTTKLCLNWLDAATLDCKKVIDYGCGSGILALAALKLGAKHVTALDIDPQALQATENNARSNHLYTPKLSIGFPEDCRNVADILIANILLTPLISLRDSFFDLLNSGGSLIVSGLLSSQTDQLIEAYQGVFELHHSFQEEEWSLLVFQRS